MPDDQSSTPAPSAPSAPTAAPSDPTAVPPPAATLDSLKAQLGEIDDKLDQLLQQGQTQAQDQESAE